MKRQITFFLICILMLSGLTPVYGNGDIKINTEIGFDNTYRSDSVTPIVITIENNKKDIDGEIQIEIPSEMGPMGVDMVSIYAIDINHPKGTVKKYTMNIPIPSSLLNTKLKIVEGKNTLIEEYVRIDRGVAENVMLAGVLSDNPANLNYLNGFTFKNIQGSTSMKIANLNEETFSVDLDVMKGFNAIIMNDYDSSKLNKEQYNTLKKWVEQGGFLIIGTGPNGGKTLSIFKDDFITGDRGEQAKVSAKGLGDIVGDSFAQTIDVMDIEVKDGENLFSENGISMAQQIDKGKGRILVLSFDIGLEPITSWKLNRYFIEALLQRAAPAIYSGQNLEKYMMSGRNYNYTMDRALRNIPELPLPGSKIIIILFAIYIVLVAPVSYIVLKKIDKRQLMWAVVPALSVVFATFIYFIGFGTRLTGPIFNKISIIYADDTGVMSFKSFGGVFTPNKSNLKVEGIEGTKVKPLLTQNYNYRSYDSQKEKKIDTKIMLYPKASVEFYDIGVWSMKTLALESDEELKGSIKGEISYGESNFKGFVENAAGFDMEDCYIISSNQYIKIGDIKNGEKKELTDQSKNYYGNRYDLMDSLYSRRHNGKMLTDAEITKVRNDNQKRDIVEYALADEVMVKEGIKFVGWAREPIGGQVKVNGKIANNYEKSLVISDMKLIIQSGKNVELPLGYIKPVINENLNRGGYDSYDNSIHGKGSVEVSFKIDENIEPQKINVSYNKAEPNVRQFIWNTEMDDWEAGDFSSFNIQDKDIAKYINQSKVLRFKFELDDSGFRLPQISVKGSVK